ncbi:MAG: cysteine--tRNA ligase, partial [Bacteroidaceae bacterium]|nr:cysteine--tRNA ligase [Bacteroidaceae bacterium]
SQQCYDAMNDDLNSPMVISALFEACRVINTVNDHKASITAEVAEALREVFRTFAFDILGLKEDSGVSNKAREEAFGKVVDMMLEQRSQAKAEKNWALSDKIRDDLAALGFEVKDTKDGYSWSLNV